MGELTLICHHCNEENAATQSFCGKCGSPLELSNYIARQVKSELASATRDQQFVETESAIRIFERAYGWVKIVGAIAVALLTIVGAGVWWKVSDWWKSVDKAQQSVIAAADDANRRIQDRASKSQQAISQSAEGAKNASISATQVISQQTKGFQTSANQTATLIKQEGTNVTAQIAATRSKLEAASALEPQMETMQQQLAHANQELANQKKLISSSEEFVKQVFSTHQTDMFFLPNGSYVVPNYVVIPRPAGAPTGAISLVYLLLKQTPISGTLQLQYHVFSQPPNTYYIVGHNLLVFFWGDPPENLFQHQLTASYFPDADDKQLFKSLTVKDGHAYVDGLILNPFLPNQATVPAQPVTQSK